MFTRAFLSLEPRDDLAWLDVYDYTTGSLMDQLRYCELLCALTDAVSNRRASDPSQPVSFVLPLPDQKTLATSSPHFALVYHALRLGAMVSMEKDGLTSLRDPLQAVLVRRLAGVFHWERVNGEHQRTAMRKHMPTTVTNFESRWESIQVALQWIAQFEEAQASSKPDKDAPGWAGVDWKLEHVLMDAHIARQRGLYSAARRLYERAKRMHRWIPPKELEAKFLSMGSHFKDHDPADTAPPRFAAVAVVYRGTPPPTVFG